MMNFNLITIHLFHSIEDLSNSSGVKSQSDEKVNFNSYLKKIL